MGSLFYRRKRSGWKGALKKIFSDSNEKKGILYAQAFFYPFLILFFVALWYEVQPFGSRSLLIVDALHQYIPFFSIYQEKLQEGNHLFYSFKSGLGINFWTLWAYYLSSPMNILIVLFPQEALNGVVSFLILVKLSLASMTMAIYLKNGFLSYRFQFKGKDKSWKILLFSMAYGLSSYMIGYSWNVMWLETMILLPVILLGFEQLMEKEKGMLYTLALFASLWCNFYMTFMTCIFLVLQFFLYSHKSFKNWFKHGILFSTYSIIAGAMAGIVLLPTYKGLMLTSSAKLEFPKPEFYLHFTDMIMTHNVTTKVITNTTFDGGTNLYCGVFTLVLLPLYIMNRKIPRSIRLKQTLLVIFLFVSFNFNWLNYVWHGFHDQYGIPNRFAYLYVFLLLTMAYQVLVCINQYTGFHFLWTLSIMIEILMIVSIFGKEKYEFSSYGIMSGIIVLYCVLFFILEKKEKIECGAYLFVILGVIELTFHTFYGFACTGQVDTTFYFSDTKSIKEAKKMLEPSEDFYRVELAKGKMLDEVTWHRLNGISLFGSNAIGNVVHTMGRLGFYSAVNEYLYQGSTPLTDSMLGVKYVFVRQGDMIPPSFSYYKTIDNIDIYRNFEALPIGYMVSEDAKNIEYDFWNPFQVQNNWASGLLGKSIELFTEIEKIPQPKVENCNIQIEDSHAFSYTVEKSSNHHIVYEWIQEEDQELYTYITGNNIEKIEITNGENIGVSGKQNSRIISIGKVKKGETVRIALKFKESEKEGRVTIRLASFDMDEFAHFYQQMKDESFYTIEEKDGYIEGIVSAKDDGLFFTSIPFDNGWTVVVDGKKIKREEYISIGDAFLAVPLKKGEHHICFLYVPDGLYGGMILSVMGSLLLYGMEKRKSIGRKIRAKYDGTKMK